MAATSDAVRVFPYPVLEEGNLAFPEGEYIPDVKSGNDGYSAHLYHDVRGAPLVEQLVRDKQAVCCCVVSIPKTGYRRLFTAEGFQQQIKWDQDWVGEPPTIHPFIVCCENIQRTLSQNDGVHEGWIGQKMHLEKGAKIALGPAFRPMSSMQSLLSVEKDDSLKSGQMRVSACSEDGFYFHVKVASDLYVFIQKPGEEDRYKHRCSILTHAVSSCFALLAKDYDKGEEEEDGWRSYSNLRALASEMESKGLSIWDMEGFCPEETATAMYPHPIPEVDGKDV